MAWDFLSPEQNKELGFGIDPKGQSQSAPPSSPVLTDYSPDDFEVVTPGTPAQPAATADDKDFEVLIPGKGMEQENTQQDKTLWQSTKNVGKAFLQGIADLYRGFYAGADNSKLMTGDFQKDWALMSPAEQAQLVQKYGDKMTQPGWDKIYAAHAKRVQKKLAADFKAAAESFPQMDKNPGGWGEQALTMATRMGPGVIAGALTGSVGGLLTFADQMLGSGYVEYRKQYPNAPKDRAFQNAFLSTALTLPFISLVTEVPSAMLRSHVAEIAGKVGAKLTKGMLAETLGFAKDMMKSAATMGLVGYTTAYPQVLTDLRMKMPNASAHELMQQFKRIVTSPDFQKQAAKGAAQLAASGTFMEAPFSLLAHSVNAYRKADAKQKAAIHQQIIDNLERAARAHLEQGDQGPVKVPGTDAGTSGIPSTKTAAEVDLDEPFVKHLQINLDEDGKIIPSNKGEGSKEAAQAGVTQDQEVAAKNLEEAKRVQKETQESAAAQAKAQEEEQKRAQEAAAQAEQAKQQDYIIQQHNQVVTAALEAGDQAAQDLSARVDQAVQEGGPQAGLAEVADQLIEAIPALRDNDSKHDTRVAGALAKAAKALVTDHPESLSDETLSRLILDLKTLGSNQDTTRKVQELHNVGTTAMALDPENGVHVATRMDLQMADLLGKDKQVEAIKQNTIDALEHLRQENRAREEQARQEKAQEDLILRQKREEDLAARRGPYDFRPGETRPEGAPPAKGKGKGESEGGGFKPIDPNNKVQVETRYRTALKQLEGRTDLTPEAKQAERARIEETFREIRSHRNRSDYTPLTGEFAEIPPRPKAKAAPEGPRSAVPPTVEAVPERKRTLNNRFRETYKPIDPNNRTQVEERYRTALARIDEHPTWNSRRKAKERKRIENIFREIRSHRGKRDYRPRVGEFAEVPPEKAQVEPKFSTRKGTDPDMLVDDTGKPLELYRGGTADLSEQSPRTGYFFSPNPETASKYAEGSFTKPAEGASVTKAHVIMRKPYTIDLKGKRFDADIVNRAVQRIRKSGRYDGVIILNAKDGTRAPENQYVVFDKGNIRSAISPEIKFSFKDPKTDKVEQISLDDAKKLLRKMKVDRLMAQLHNLPQKDLDQMEGAIRDLSNQLAQFAQDKAGKGTGKAAGPNVGGATREDVSKWIGKRQRRARGAANTVVVQSQSELPKRILQMAQKDSLIEGLYDPETHTVYLVADNLPNRKVALQKWVHEQVGHVGLRGLFGHEPTYRKFLRDTYSLVMGSDKATKNTMQQIVDEYGFDVKNKTIKGVKARESAAEEFLARRVETQRLAPKLWRQIKKMFMDFLHRWMPTDPLDPHAYKLTMDDVDGILDAAKGYTQNGWTLSNAIGERLARRWGDIPMRKDLLDAVRKRLGAKAATKIPKFRMSEDEFLQLVKDTYKKYPESRFFYQEGKQIMQDRFGPDADIMNILLALTSPGADLSQNMQYAFQTYMHLLGVPGGKINARFPARLAERIKKWTSLDALIQDALNDAGSFKVTEYRWGLMGDGNAVVNDRWMKRVLFGSDFAFGGKDASLRTYEHLAARQMILELTNRMTQDTGEQWTPQEVQAVLWAHGRNTRSPGTMAEYDYVTAGNKKMNQLGGMGAWDWIQKKARDAGIDLRAGNLLKKWGYSDPDAIIKFVNTRRMERGRERLFGPLDLLKPTPDSLGMGVHYKNTFIEEGGKLKATQLVVDRDKNAIVKNSYSRSDLGRRMDANTPDNPYQPLVYFYHAGTIPESQLGSKPIRVNVEFDKDRIYDAIKDVYGLHKQAVKEMIRDPNIWYNGTGDPTMDGAYTNVLARLIKDKGQFDGFLVADPRNPKGRWVLLFDEAPITHGFLKDVPVGISDVVESEQASDQAIERLDQQAREHTRAFEKRMRRLNKSYPEITLEQVEPSIAQFGEATSGLMELGAGLNITGPKQSVKAFLAELGIEHKQGQIYLMQPVTSKAKRNGVMFEFETPFTSAKDLREALKKHGVSEFNMIKGRMGTFRVRQFVFENPEAIKNFEMVLKDLATPGHPRNTVYDVNSEILGDVNYSGSPEDAMAGYRNELIKFYGEKDGQARYEQALKRQDAYLKAAKEDTGTSGNGETDKPIRLYPDKRGSDNRNVPSEPPPDQGGKGGTGSPGKKDKGGWVIDPKQINPKNTGPSFSYKLSEGTPPPEVEKWIDQIGGHDLTFKERVKRASKKFLDLRANFLDKYAQLDRLEKAATGGKGVRPDLSGYKSWRMLSSLPTIMEQALEHGDVQFRDNWITVKKNPKGGLLDVFKDLGSDTNDFLLWMTGQSALELMARGDRKEPIFGVSKADDMAKIKGLLSRSAGKDRAKWESAARRLHEINNSFLDFAEKAGIIDAEARKSWQRDNYIPFYRMLDSYETGDLESMFPKGGDNATVKTIKRLEGSKLVLGDGLENLIHAYTFLTKEGLKNLANKKALKLMLENGLAEEAPRQATPGKRGVVSIRVRGKELKYRISDPTLFEAIQQTPMAVSSGFLRWWKKALTYGVTLAPAFRIANFMRDTLATGVLEGQMLRQMGRAVRGFADSWNNSPEAVEYRGTGGAFGSGIYRADNPESVGRYIRRVTKKAHHSGAIIKSLTGLYNLWERVGNAAEEANRLALYKREVRAGKSTFEAGFRAKDLMDFHLTGKANILQTAVQLIPFLNARIQGLYKLGRSAFSKETAAGFWLRGMALSTAMLALAYHNDKDQRYLDLPDYEKYQYIHAWIGNYHVRVPVPFEVGIIFGTAPTAIMETLRGTEDLEQLKKWAAFSFTQTLNVNPIPQFLKPGVESAFNKDIFTGRQIVPEAQKNLPPEMQYGPRTSTTAKVLAKSTPGKFIGASPRHIDHLVRGYFGAAGSGAVLMLDQLLEQALPASELPPKPSGDIRSWPGIGRFLRGTGQPRATRYDADFYNLLHEATTAFEGVKRKRELGDPKAAARLAKESRALLAQRRVLGRDRRQLSAIYKQMQRVYENKTMSGARKRQIIDNLLRRKQRITKRAVLRYRRVKNRMSEE